jgi:hypothetical protein
MDSLIHFIIQNQKHLSPDTQLRVSVGKYIVYPNILDTRLSMGQVLSILNSIRQARLLTRDNGKTVNQRIYKYRDMEYIYSRNGESNTSKRILDTIQIKQDKNGFKANLEERRNRRIEDFPCSIEYNDILDCTRIWYNINNLFDLCIVTEQDQRGEKHTRIELVLACQNIYEEKLQSALQNVLGKIETGINTDSI